VRFFVRSYTRRGGVSKNSRPSKRISQAAEDAAHGVGREVDSLGKAAENGVGDLASNVLNKINGSGTPNIGERRRNVSATIESKVRNFEKSEDGTSGAVEESSVDKKKSQESLRVSVIRKKASEEHNKLRSMFEDGQAFGRSVDHSNTDSIFRTKPNNTESRSRLLSADGEDEEKYQGVVAVVESNEGAGAGAEEGEKESRTIDEVHEDEGENKGNQKETKDTESQLVSVSNNAKEELQNAQRNDSHQTLSADSPNLITSNDADTNDPFIDPLPSQTPSFPSSISRTTSEPTAKHLSAIPVLGHTSTASIQPRSSSPTRPSKIPKLSRTGSPLKRSATSPAGSLLSPAKTTTIAYVNDVNGVSATVTTNGIVTGGGARDRGK
jgi:hypothetical protein